METIIPPGIQNKPELLSRVKQATKWLETKLGDFVEEVKAEWNPAEDQNGRPLLELTISDWSGKAQERFSVTQLDDPSYVQHQLSSTFALFGGNESSEKIRVSQFGFGLFAHPPR